MSRYIHKNGINYGFSIKCYHVNADMSNETWGIEVEEVLENCINKIQRTYKWVNSVHISGRMGGWLIIVAEREICDSVLQTIYRLVNKERIRFVKRMEKKYPRVEQ